GAALGLATNLGRGIGYFTNDVRNGYSLRWNLSVQRELPGNAIVEAGYIYNHGVHLDLTRQLDFIPAQFLSAKLTRDQATIDRLSANVSNPFAGLIPGTTLNGSTAQRSQLLRPYPHFTGINERTVPEGSSFFHMFQVRIEKRFSHGIQFLGNYLFTKLIYTLT